MRVKTLIASSSALIAAVIFAVASPASPASASTATSAHRNVASAQNAASASAVNAGGFENSAGRIAAAPVTPQTPKNGPCAGNWGNVVANMLLQRAKTGGLAWGFFLTKVAREKLGAVVTVTMPGCHDQQQGDQPALFVAHPVEWLQLPFQPEVLQFCRVQNQA